MTKTELLELIEHGENSGVELKRDGVHPEKFAQEIAALLNLEGGHILLGVEDDLMVTGLVRAPKEAEEWVMNVARDHVRPATIPYWETIEVEAGKRVGVVTLPADSPDKPYKAKRGSAWVTVVRVGTTTRDATHAEEERLYQQSGSLRYEKKPVPGASWRDLDQGRLTSYFRDTRGQDTPDPDDEESWLRRLLNTGLAIENRGLTIPTVAAILMFGRTPNRHLPQAGVTATCYPTSEKDYAAKERATIRGPVVPLLNRYAEVMETGVIERTVEFVRRNTNIQAALADGARRVERWDYPEEALRECVVNAIAHRDYTIAVTDIELSIYDNRLEIVSPGRLPNTVTPEKMREGCRATRNQVVMDTLRDYGYIENAGLGVPRKIVHGMREHNGTEPDLVEEEDRFTVRLWKDPRG